MSAFMLAQGDPLRFHGPLGPPEERDRLQVLRELKQGGLRQVAAAQRMK
jgi:hypothetical protein